MSLPVKKAATLTNCLTRLKDLLTPHQGNQEENKATLQELGPDRLVNLLKLTITPTKESPAHDRCILAYTCM